MTMKNDIKNSLLPQLVSFSQPFQQAITMLLIVGLVGAGGWLIHLQVASVFLSNLWLNGLIAVVFGFGVLACFWQVATLVYSVSWIESFAKNTSHAPKQRPPRLLAPLATLLRGREAQMQIAESSARSILDSVSTRIEEARDITRYLSNLLVFLGLLGTFYGLATTVPAIVETIRALAPQDDGQSGLSIFTKLISGLEVQLGGMGTAFSSSLLGLAGSLVVGLLELFAGNGQNRFYRELEEWLSSFTRFDFAEGGEGNAGLPNVETLTPAMLEKVTEQMSLLQEMTAQTAAARRESDVRIAQLGDAVMALAARMEGGADLGREQIRLSSRMLEGQERLVGVLEQVETGFTADAEARMRLRSIDVQLLRILEEIAAGRQESLAELRGDLTKVTDALARLDTTRV